MREPLAFSLEQICLTGPVQLARIAQQLSEQNLKEEQRILYPLLPTPLRERYSLEDFLAAYEQSREKRMQSIITWQGKKVTGYYDLEQDVCYISTKNPVRNKYHSGTMICSIAVHELAHREMCQTRLRRTAHFPKAWVNYSDAEESFCQEVEKLYSQLLFSRREIDSDQLELLLDNRAESLNHLEIRRYTRQRVQFYTDLLRGKAN